MTLHSKLATPLREDTIFRRPAEPLLYLFLFLCMPTPPFPRKAHLSQVARRALCLFFTSYHTFLLHPACQFVCLSHFSWRLRARCAHPRVHCLARLAAKPIPAYPRMQVSGRRY